MTYMNNSGASVKKFIDYYKINLDDIIIIYDDMDFDLGQFKIKNSGSSAGHNGIKSIISHINTENFKRIRVGISRNKNDKVNYVLGKFNVEDLEKLNKVLEIVKNIINYFLIIDFDKLMCHYN